MEVKCLVITPEGLRPVERPEDFKVDLDAMPQHKRESFMIAQLAAVRRWVAAQEAEETKNK